MTVGTRLLTTYASLRGAVAGLRQQAANDSRHGAEHVLSETADELEEVVKDLSTRIDEIEREEPEYKSP